MSVVITDELRLLIRAEAEQAIKEVSSYRTGVMGAASAHKDFSQTAKSVSRELLSSLGIYASVGAAVSGIIRYAGQASDAFTESQGEIRKFEITYRDVLKEAEQVTSSWAETFNYAESTAKQVLGSAGDIYTGMGIAAEGALGLADRTAYLGGALSKLNPQLGSAADATQALISSATGEREALKRWGIIIQETAVQQKLLERGQDDLTGSALLAAKAQATLDIAYEQSPNALNAVAGKTQLVADTNRYLSETWKEHLELSGQVISQSLQPLKKAAADYLKERNELTKAEREANEVGIDIDAVKAYSDTADQVERLTAEYDQLKSKSLLNVEQQVRLKEVVQELGRLVPSAASGWDTYGKALGISADKAREFAKQQRELRELEIAIQSAALERQQYMLDVTREEDLATKERAEKRLAPLLEEQQLLEKAHAVALEYVETVSGRKFSDQDAAFAEGAQLLKDHAEAFKQAGLELSPDVVNPGPAITNLINEYDKLEDKIAGLNGKQADAVANLMEYDLVSAQIEQLRAELGYLTGDTDDLIGSLEHEAQSIPGVAGTFRQLQFEYSQGEMSVDAYRAALEDLISSASKPIEPDASGVTAWNGFVKNLTDGVSLDSAIGYEVELSPIIADTGTTKLESQLEYYEDLIQGLWGAKDQFSSLEQWQDALNDLVPKYEEIRSHIEEITEGKKQEAQAEEIKFGLLDSQGQMTAKLAEYEQSIIPLIEAGLLTEEEKAAALAQQKETLKETLGITKEEEEHSEKVAEANKLILSLGTQQEQNAAVLAEYEEKLLGLKSEGLLTEEQAKALLKQKNEELDELTKKTETWSDYLSEAWADIKDEFFCFDAIGDLISDTFSDIGAAIGSGEDVTEAAGKALQSYATQLLKEISTMAIGAGLRVIVEGGLAALPLAIGLFALGGVAGIGSGFFGSSGSGVDSSIMESLDDELKIRESLNETLGEALDLEMDMLKRQLDRNLISVEDYMSGVQDIWGQRNQGDAQEEAIGLISEAIGDIDTELSDMSGWSKLRSSKDEDLEADATSLEDLARQINAASSAEELRALIQQLEDYGINVDSLPAFAQGGSFLTSGPQPILVGDNASGRELVQITPLGSGSGQTLDQPIVVNINGPVLDYADLQKKLDAIGVKLDRRKQRRVS